MPKVRASSGMIGTTRRPIFSSRHRLRNNRVNPIVVLTGNSPDPIRSSWKTSSAGSESGRLTATRRVGDPAERLSAFHHVLVFDGVFAWPEVRRVVFFGIQSEFRRGDGDDCAAQVTGRGSSLIWWVALRPSKPGPNVHPLTVLHRMTVGRPLPRFSVVAL